MNVYVSSDLHNEYNSQFMSGGSSNLLENITPDDSLDSVLVVAGDLSSKGHAVRDLEAIAEDWLAVVYTPGNHCFWGLAIHETHKFKSHVENVYILQEETVEIGGVLFGGTTAWPHIANQVHWAGVMNDAKYIRGPSYRKLRASDLNTLHSKSMAFIADFASMQFEGVKFLVTHMAMSAKSLSELYAGESSNQYYTSYKPELLMGIDYHAHGHTHRTVSYTEGNGCITLINAHGYCLENPDYDPLFHVTIKT